MTASTLSGLTGKNAEDSTPPVAQAKPDNAPPARIDFAHVANNQFLVYGWILGFRKSVPSASIHFGDVVIDLVKQAVPVRRADIAQHFSLEEGDDQHGFHVLVDLSDRFAFVDHLRLSVTLSSGEKSETHWPVLGPGNVPSSVTEPYLATFNGLLPLLPRREAKRLIEFAAAAGLRMEADLLTTLPPPVRFAIDQCCLLENQILLIGGWIFDPAKDLTLAQLRVGASLFNLLENSVLVPRPEVETDSALYRKRDTPQNPGFIFVQAISHPDTDAEEARFTFTAATETVRTSRPISRVPQDARRELLSLLKKMDSDSVLALIERIATILDDSPEQRSLGALLELICHSAIERLPVSIQHSNPRYSLHIDQAIPVVDKGVFLIGWFNGDSGVSARVVCHCGLSSFVISDHWIRQVRADVTSHLANLGIQSPDHQHGFTCYVPLKNGDAPYYLSAGLESGDVRRMSVAVPEKAGSALQTVRSLLTFFHGDNSDLRLLMENQIGPLVQTTWAARHRPARKPLLRTYGAAPVDPLVSIIVPLYGRHDFAEYQMALFADDPEFQRVELIYVVDEPAIFAEFSGVCVDLHEIYQVPFRVAFSGANLGFAGANNFGAEAARAPHLLLLNSDVLPKRPGWLGDLLHIYRSLPSPGLVGAKLLYEDGSVQHAGMAFRRHSAWGDLWINDHPFKGQSPLGLTGVRQVDAVTAACVVIEASLYRELGGFSEDYIVGDFEDSDLCLRASLAGRRSYVALDVELYHLERQSQNRMGDATWRTNLTLYNCWLHHSRWSDLIERTRDRNHFAHQGDIK
jgi:O-antigen biosynthesis protein